MSHNDYVKFITEQIVSHMNKTKQERKVQKQNNSTLSVSNKWFGIFPFTLKLLLKK
ncbi:YqzE family protein [Pseudogracilibacillus sp. SE30717A]|uniref:YqzE family protein n=1 Tax=Pseudogracilibacillus sp. SE30717A TaxID=3098293 RepID=UPI00300DE6D2